MKTAVRLFVVIGLAVLFGGPGLSPADVELCEPVSVCAEWEDEPEDTSTESVPPAAVTPSSTPACAPSPRHRHRGVIRGATIGPRRVQR